MTLTASIVDLLGCLVMPHAATRRWTLPLSALLLVNTALVASAFWHVGRDVEPDQAQAAASLVDEPIVKPIVEEPVVELGVNDSPNGAAASEGLQVSSRDNEAAAAPEAALLTSETSVADSTPEPWGDEAASLPPPVVIGNLPSTATTDNAPDTVPTTTPIVVLVEDLTPAPAPSVEPPVEQPRNDRESLVIVNPPTTGGVVHFVANDQTFSLAPGELQRLIASEKNRVRFHRGDEFGNADERCPTGVFAFAVAESGWSLGEVSGPSAARLLEICVPAPANRPSGDN